MSQLKYFIPAVSSGNLGPRQEILDIVPIAMSQFPQDPRTSAGSSKGWGLRRGLGASWLSVEGKGEPQEPCLS